MNFSIQRPYAFWCLLVLIPALIYLFTNYGKLVNTAKKNKVSLKKLRTSFVLRTFFRCLSWIMIVFALAGISWGTRYVPVQKTGHSVSFVFDISYSMMSHDAPDGMSRLESAAGYADELLDYMDGSSVSVVLAKGGGTVAVPMTEDMEAVRNILAVLSPSLMTSAGTDLGGGIDAAVSAFPRQSSQSSCIWLFTDGEETTGSLESSLSKAISYGIPVAIIGFGSERESEVTAGDGKTVVKTALRADALKKTIDEVLKKKKNSRSSSRNVQLFYIDASEFGSAFKLLNMLHLDEVTSTTYELKNIERYMLFLTLSVIFFALSFLMGELNTDGRRKNKNKTAKAASVLILLSLFTFTGCSQRFSDGRKILSGRLSYNSKNYPEAVAEFLDAAEDARSRGDQEILDYALFGLATTYLAQDEYDASLVRFDQIAENADDDILFGVYYNAGIIAHRQGKYEKAAELFKKALLIKSQDINAKINLELSISEETLSSGQEESVLTPVNETEDESSMENALYSIIRENEQNQWKNQMQDSSGSSQDY